MGSSSNKSSMVINRTEPIQIDFKSRKEKYTELKTKTDLLIARDMCNQLTEIENGSLSSLDFRVKTSFAANETKIKEAKITQDEYYSVIYETVTTKIIRTYFQIPSYNMFRVIPAYCLKLNLPEEKYSQIKIAMEYFEKEFDNDMMAIVYNLNNEVRDLETDLLLGLNRNLKYNDTYQPRILNIILTPFLMKNEDIITDLAELIQFGEKLQIVSIIIHPIDEDGNYYEEFNLNISNQKILNRLLSAVEKNKLIKGLFIHCTEEYRIIIAPETSNLIINKLQSETLVAFHLGKFELSDDLFNNLLFQLTSTRSMLFFSLDTKKMWRLLLNKILPAVIPNTSLTAIALTGLKVSVSKDLIEEFEKRLKEKNKEIDLIYCGEESVVKYPFPLS